MLAIQITREDGKITAAQAFEFDKIDRRAPNVETRNDWKTFDAAKEVAAALGEGYIATDAGPHVSPRYDVIDIPKIGAAVSYTFNGDYYPCGTVKSVSPTLRKIVAGPDFSGNDRAFFRRGERGVWVHEKTWSLIPGTISRINPEF
jgi:hypothetical protein